MNKLTKSEIIPTPVFLYRFIEKHLSKKRSQGWELVQVRWFKYTYIKKRPSNAVYFIYNAGGTRGNEPKKSLSRFYGNIREEFGKKGSILNTSYRNGMYRISLMGPDFFKKRKKRNVYASFSGFEVVEVDEKRVDSKIFKEMVRDRNRLHFWREIKYNLSFLVAGLCLVLFPYLSKLAPFGFFAIIWAAGTIILNLTSYIISYRESSI